MLQRLGPLLLLSVGCSAVMADDDAHVFGEDLGRFGIEATLVESSCGPDALGTPEHWRFDVQLSRDDTTIHWNQGGAAVEGRIETDAVSFVVDSLTEVPVPLDEQGAIVCRMQRFDRARGKLDSPGYDVTGFSGRLVYRFVAEPGDSCDGVVGVPGGFAQLPCEIAFDIQAERNLAPRDRH